MVRQAIEESNVTLARYPRNPLTWDHRCQVSHRTLPPIIDRELLFGDPEISGAQLSPDGEYIAFMKPWKDTRNIWVKKTNQPFSSARLHDHRNRAARGGLSLEPRQPSTSSL